MKKEKGVVLGVVILCIVMLCVVNVNAGFLDFVFGEGDGGDGELASENADVSITMANSPPHIESWNDPLNYFSSGDCDLPTTTVPITIIVSDPNGDEDLNLGTVTVQFSLGGVSRPVSPASCSAGTPNGDNELEFTCSLDMYYYDAAASNWVITVSALDNGGTPADNGGGTGIQISTGPGDYPYFTYGSSLSIRLADENDDDFNNPGVLPDTQDTLEWVGLVATAIDSDADVNLIVGNCGNIEITGTSTNVLDIVGNDLVGLTSGNLAVIEPDSFLVSGLNDPCVSGQELDNVDPLESVDITNFALSIDSGAQSGLYFCIQSVNPTGGNIAPDDYKTATPWEIDVSE